MEELNVIEARQNEAFSAYEMYYARELISDDPVKFAALQAGMLAEIALQLQRQNALLERIASNLDTIPVDIIMHTDEQPFCSDMDCPCHEDRELIRQYLEQPVETGLLNVIEANRIFRGIQL